MSLLKFNNIAITGISAVVPRHVKKNREYITPANRKEIESTIKTTGIEERRIAPKGICASDLCLEAAGRLLREMQINRESIDMLIFVSQTPDYHQPATACILQDRLKLSKSTAAFDINLACSGYVYGLSTAFAFASSDGIGRVLLLVGETMSKIVSDEDKTTRLLFGDAGSATLIEKNSRYPQSYFSLSTDGAGESVLKINGGGYRNPSSIETIKSAKHDDGGIRSDENLFMDGIEVFNFTMREVPKDIRKILEYSEKSMKDIEYVIFHQANKFITDYFAKKLKISKEKIIYSLDRFGNTSSVSIPLTIVSELKDSTLKDASILCGYGGGLSWGKAIINLDYAYIVQLGEV
jgi:3-oxoacyl-[acyl-carrier-protein] synthase III